MRTGSVLLFAALLIGGSVGLAMTQPTRAVQARQEAAAVAHTVVPGDTWQALSLRFDANQTELQALNNHINTGREPAIGSAIWLPPSTSEVTGTLRRTGNGGLLETAASADLSPWRLALLNGMDSPYQPGLWRLIRVPGDATPRELPVGAAAVALAPESPSPGQALVAHMALSPGQNSARVALDGTLLAATVSAGDVVAVGGTGAFFEPGEPELSISIGEQPVWRQPWTINDRDWIFQQLTLTGEAAQIDQEAIQAERARLTEIWSQVTPQPLWSAAFQLPIADYLEVSADYGARRSYNGGPYRSYHEGVDFSAYRGTPVFAPAAGTVVLAEPLYVRGGAVIIDHGLGIYTGYYHLSAVHATPGQEVAPGDLLGEVGTTGLSTGNHLHWDLIVNNTWVDAMSWLEQDTACWILAALGGACEAPAG